MPPRLAHKKSRKGCRRCKDRKVKCSEDWPSCAACSRHNVPCEYGEEARMATASESLASQTEGSGSGGSEFGDSNKGSFTGIDAPYHLIGQDDLNLSESKRHATELYLIHRYKSSVAVSFPSFESLELSEIWLWSVVDLAFKYPFLLNAILAVTSLYICVTSSTPRSEGESKPIPEPLRDVDFAQLHRMYLNLSICQQRDALANLTADNADAVGLAAVLLSLMATCLLSDDTEMEDSGYQPPIQWLLMHASIAEVFHNAVPFLQPDGPVIRYTILTREPAIEEPVDPLDPENIAPFQRLLGFQDPTDFAAQNEETDPAVKEAYVRTVAYIGSMHHALRRIENRYKICMRVVSFGHKIPRTFIHLLSERKPRALAILANYMAFVRYIDKYWWFRGRSQQQITSISQVLPQQWQWALNWPLAVLKDPGNVLLDPRPFGCVVSG